MSAAALTALTALGKAERWARIGWGMGLVLLLVAPFIGLYPVFVMTALCYAIFACAFNLLLGFTGRSISTMAMMTKTTMLDASG